MNINKQLILNKGQLLPILLCVHDYYQSFNVPTLCIGAYKVKYQVDGIYTDFLKDFDKFNHGIMISFILSFLTGKKQYVKIMSEYNVSSGVSLEFNFVVLLLDIFIIIFTNGFKFSNIIVLFADNQKLFRIIQTLNNS